MYLQLSFTVSSGYGRARRKQGGVACMKIKTPHPSSARMASSPSRESFMYTKAKPAHTPRPEAGTVRGFPRRTAAGAPQNRYCGPLTSPAAALQAPLGSQGRSQVEQRWVAAEPGLVAGRCGCKRGRDRQTLLRAASTTPLAGDPGAGASWLSRDDQDASCCLVVGPHKEAP
jgi:hypothetical protein